MNRLFHSLGTALACLLLPFSGRAASLTILHDFQTLSNSTGFNPTSTLVQDTAGTGVIYDTCSLGIFRVQTNGTGFALFPTFTNGGPQVFRRSHHLQQCAIRRCDGRKVNLLRGEHISGEYRWLWMSHSPRSFFHPCPPAPMPKDLSPSPVARGGKYALWRRGFPARVPGGSGAVFQNQYR